MVRVSLDERRSSFIDATIYVIATRGVDGATTRRIAEQAGAPLASLHYCFSSKGVLFAAAYERIALELRRTILDDDGVKGFAAAAHGILCRVSTCYIDSPDFAAAAAALINWARRHQRDLVLNLYDQVLEAARVTLMRAAQDPPVSPRVIEQAVHVLSAMTDGFATNWLACADRETADDQVKALSAALDAWMSAKLSDTTPSAPMRAGRAASRITSSATWIDPR